MKMLSLSNTSNIPKSHNFSYEELIRPQMNLQSHFYQQQNKKKHWN